MSVQPRLAIAVALVLALGGAYATLASSPPEPPVRRVTLEAVAIPCAESGTFPQSDGVCLAYNGVVPGPTIELRLGERLEVTLVNRIAETIAPLDADAELKARLSQAAISWHVHGTSLPASEDGIMAHPGTNLVESVAAPGGSFTYHVRAAFAGPWHYHDHVLGMDGDEGVKRGLYGGLVVRSAAEPASRVVDLHMLNAGGNGGRAFVANATAGERVDVLVVGLDDLVWTVTLRDPANAVVGRVVVGPGMSERIAIPSATEGVYRWSATGGPPSSGELVVEGAP